MACTLHATQIALAARVQLGLVNSQVLYHMLKSFAAGVQVVLAQRDFELMVAARLVAFASLVSCILQQDVTTLWDMFNGCLEPSWSTVPVQKVRVRFSQPDPTGQLVEAACPRVHKLPSA